MSTVYSLKKKQQYIALTPSDKAKKKKMCEVKKKNNLRLLPQTYSRRRLVCK